LRHVQQNASKGVPKMSSGSYRGFTVVTIITLIFSPIFMHHQWLYRLTGTTSETHTVQCVVNKPCPTRQLIVNVVFQPIPRKAGNHDDGSSQDFALVDATTLASISAAQAP
jgi:hypothetical protein